MKQLNSVLEELHNSKIKSKELEKALQFIKNNKAVKDFFSTWKDDEILINVQDATESMKISLQHFKGQNIPKSIIWFYNYGNGDRLGLDKTTNHILEYQHEEGHIIDRTTKKVLFKHQ